MEEIFKDVIGFEDRLQISNKGNVFSKLSKRLLKASISASGYVTLSTKVGGRQGKAYLLRIHRLVGEAFIPNTECKPEVNHIDGNKLNNTVANLEWVTHKENMCHASKLGLLKQSLANNSAKYK